MNARTRTHWRALLAATLCALASAGCQLPLPAIDPTGTRIFLPPPASTTLAFPHGPLPLPTPAYPSPPPVPPCPDVAVGPPALPPVGPPPGKALGELLPVTPVASLELHPSHVIAPVGSEVALVAGLRDADARLRSRETIEWLLSQDSVGHLLNVDDGGHWHRCRWSRWLHPCRPEVGKRTASFAVTRSTHRPATLTRGSPAPADNVPVDRGQTWITVTSPTEGTSHVTAWAPDAPAWDQRRRTATVYWVDAQWSLPPPAIVPAGQRHVLSTVVSRSTTGTPIGNWRIIYEVVGGAPATFAATGQPTAEVVADAAGRADVELVPLSGTAGTSEVRIAIVRPELPGDDMPRLVVGQGRTTVSWSAPGLAVEVRGPETATTGATLVYQVRVSNPGDLPTENVVVQDTLPPNLELLTSEPTAQPRLDRSRWDLGTLPPSASRTIEVRLRAVRAGEVRYCFDATGGALAAAQACAATRIVEPALRVSVSGPEAATVGQRVTYQIDVTNTSGQALPDVTLRSTFDPGLRHSEDQLSPIAVSLGALAPGQTTAKAVTFIVERPGTLCHTLEVVAGLHTYRHRSCLTASPARPTVSVRIDGPEQLLAGESGEFQITVSNTGDVPIEPLTITQLHPPQLTPLRASPGHRLVAANEIQQPLPRLGPGEQQALRIVHQGVEPGQGIVQARVLSGDVVLAAAERAVQVVRRPTETPPSPDPSPTPTPPVPATGDLEVTLVGIGDPVRPGEQTRYLISIQNLRDRSDRNLTVTVRPSPGMRLEAWSGPVGSQFTDGAIRFNPVVEVRPGETLPRYEVTAQPTAEAVARGDMTLTVEVTSQLSPEPVQAQERTTVLAE